MAVHFTGPILHDGRQSLRGHLTDAPISINPEYVSVWYDFMEVAADATNLWTEIKDTGASQDIRADIQHGVYRFTSAATTDNDGASIQQNETWAATASKDLWFFARVAASEATQSEWMVGLTENFATNPEAMLAAAEHIAFIKADGAATIACATESGGTATSTASGVSTADDTYNELAIHVVGTGTVKFYIDKKLVATNTTNIPTANLTIGAYHISGSATGTMTFDIDYLGAAATR